MEREKGEVCVGNLAGTVYDPSLEWPGHDEVPTFEAASSLPPQTSTLRLIVESSTILSSNKRIAILDGHAEIQLGRDAPSAGTDTPRLRLKELAVSKLHATIFWDKDREEWAIVDMGSVHGTFIASEGAPGCTSSASVIASARLSAPRVASIPRTLRHLDRLRCGGTTFVVHIHASGLPCIQCSALSTTNADEIPLYQTGASSESPSRSTEKRKRDGLNSGETNWSKGSGRKDVKTALTTLKRDLLRRQEMPTAPAGKHPSVYVDRSARRRALHSHSAADAPGRRSLPADTPDWVVLYPPPPVTPPLHPAPATPISEMTAGYKLLAKQGWKPGSALGLPDGTGTGVRLLEPITPAALPARAGLGIVPRVADFDLRRDESRVKRHWREAQWM